MSDIELTGRIAIAGPDNLTDDSSDLTYEQQVAAFSDFSDFNLLVDKLLYNPGKPEENLVDNSLYLLDGLYDLDSSDLVRPENKNLFVSMPHLENEIIAIAARVSKGLGIYSSGNYEAYAQIVAESLYDLVEATKLMDSEAKRVF
ncbi:MAG: hypothetical protein KAJ88_00635 [Candidatus Aenigmarchaeota archaeon]|nr:hypothetical protein [Candidatus Aenigmarchaeota archaeon]